ncbi:hypothetical protein [Mucilaginibacter sp. 21P]|nr:hypothetical protein [Mucilaginibacter sp. 21P]
MIGHHSWSWNFGADFTFFMISKTKGMHMAFIIANNRKAFL